MNSYFVYIDRILVYNKKYETLESLRKKYEKISPIQAQSYWENLYHKAASLCIHSIR